MITEFVDVLAKAAKLPAGRLKGTYLTSEAEALRTFEAAPDAFLMGSLSFYLAHRGELKLMPLAKTIFPEDTHEQYHLLVKKGAFASLDGLKGKTLSGSTLYAGPTFLSRIVFTNAVDAAKHFTLKPTSRPLSAVRNVLRGRLDAVLLNQVQYRSLQRLSQFGELQVLHTSPRLPPLAFTMTDTPRTRELRGPMLKAVTGLADDEAGKTALANFAIKGFAPISSNELSEVTRTYDNP